MIKVWHEECKGKGIISRNNGGYLIECTDCGGKGYTEHEGSLEDLELAAAVKEYYNQGNVCCVDLSKGIGTNKILMSELKLLEWYKHQKGGNNE